MPLEQFLKQCDFYLRNPLLFISSRELFKGNETFIKIWQYNEVLVLYWEELKAVSIFSRIRDIVENGIDSLDKTEDLEKMVEQNLQDLNRDLGKVKAEVESCWLQERAKSEQLKPIHDQLIADIRELESIKRSGF